MNKDEKELREEQWFDSVFDLAFRLLPTKRNPEHPHTRFAKVARKGKSAEITVIDGAMAALMVARIPINGSIIPNQFYLDRRQLLEFKKLIWWRIGRGAGKTTSKVIHVKDGVGTPTTFPTATGIASVCERENNIEALFHFPFAGEICDALRLFPSHKAMFVILDGRQAIFMHPSDEGHIFAAIECNHGYRPHVFAIRPWYLLAFAEAFYGEEMEIGCASAPESKTMEIQGYTWHEGQLFATFPKYHKQRYTFTFMTCRAEGLFPLGDIEGSFIRMVTKAKAIAEAVGGSR